SQTNEILAQQGKKPIDWTPVISE
ncbi:uracil-DNA glycosylase, partial [Escherichia coli]